VKVVLYGLVVSNTDDEMKRMLDIVQVSKMHHQQKQQIPLKRCKDANSIIYSSQIIQGRA
jgi:hypothetical protein